MAYDPRYFVAAVLHLCPGLVANVDFEAADYGDGPVISRWNRSDVPQPTAAEIEAVDTDGITGVPASVTPRQARLALLNAGLLDHVEAAVQSAGGATRITWEYASYISRSDPLITGIGASLNLTESQIDDLFRAAGTL
jgi:hypothetical protein